MHIAIFLDQHLHTLGGVQTSVKLQKKYLERLGHKVTICSPASHGHRNGGEGFVITPSFAISDRGEYHATIPSAKIERRIDAAFAKLPPVDIVHVQADYWGAILGLSFAKRHSIPSVVTFHNNVQVGIDKTLGKPVGRLLILMMRSLARRTISKKWHGPASEPWNYLNNIALHADTLLTPTNHFARDLKAHGMRGEVIAMSNGIDDDVLAQTKRRPHGGEPVFLWAGRMSREKLLPEYIEAIHRSGVPAQFWIYGAGEDKLIAKRLVKRHKIPHVKFKGVIPYQEMIDTFATADVLVQTSINFETQGMTVFEAAMLGTPVILRDPLIAEDFPPDAFWPVPGPSVDELATTIRQAYDDIKSGKRGLFKMDNKYNYRQSIMTAKVVKIYEDTIEKAKVKK